MDRREGWRIMISNITVGGVNYSVAQAPAIKQKKLMLLIGAKIAFNSAASKSGIDRDLLMGALCSFPEPMFDEIASIVLYKTSVVGDSTIIDVGAFQGGMLNFFHLVAEAVKLNLDDFFIYLDSVNKSANQAVQPKANQA